MEQELEGFVGASDPGARERWNKPAYTYQERDYAGTFSSVTLNCSY